MTYRSLKALTVGIAAMSMIVLTGAADAAGRGGGGGGHGGGYGGGGGGHHRGYGDYRGYSGYGGYAGYGGYGVAAFFDDSDYGYASYSSDNDCSRLRRRARELGTQRAWARYRQCRNGDDD